MKLASIIPFITLIAGGLIGGGAIWQYQANKIAEQNYELSKLERINEIRSRQNEINIDLLDYVNQHSELSAYKSENKDGKNPHLINNQAVNTLEKFRIKEQEYIRLEDELSKLESRKPREINFRRYFPPKPPTIITIQ